MFEVILTKANDTFLKTFQSFFANFPTVESLKVFFYYCYPIGSRWNLLGSPGLGLEQITWADGGWDYHLPPLSCSWSGFSFHKVCEYSISALTFCFLPLQQIADPYWQGKSNINMLFLICLFSFSVRRRSWSVWRGTTTEGWHAHTHPWTDGGCWRCSAIGCLISEGW